MKNYTLSAILTATLALGISYAGADQWLWTLISIGAGMLWLISEWHDVRGFTALELTTFVGLAAWGLWLEASGLGMLIGTVAALIAWDLARFSERITPLEPNSEASPLLQPHLHRLRVAASLGLLLGGAALGLQFSLSFGWALFLALLMTITLSWAVRSIRRSS